MNNLKAMISEKESLLKKLDALIIEFEAANVSISTLEQAHDGLIFDGANTDISLVELTTASIRRDSLRRVIGDIQNNLIPIADEKVEVEKEKAIEDIRAVHQTLYDKCKTDIQKKMGDVSRIIQTFDSECEKVESEVGLSAGLNLPVFFIAGDDRLQFTD
jgi:hypothetical protein